MPNTNLSIGPELLRIESTEKQVILEHELKEAMLEDNTYQAYVINQLPGGTGDNSPRSTLGIVEHWNRWWHRDYVAQEEKTSNIEHLDEDREDLEDMLNLGREHGFIVPKIAGKLAAIARTELTILTRDKATLLVVREYLLRLCKKHSMRSVDISRVLPYAVQLSFVPTRHELQARAMTLQYEYLERDEIQRRSLYTREKPWLFNWFGRKRTEPVVTDQ